MELWQLLEMLQTAYRSIENQMSSKFSIRKVLTYRPMAMQDSWFALQKKSEVKTSIKPLQRTQLCIREAANFQTLRRISEACTKVRER